MLLNHSKKGNADFFVFQLHHSWGEAYTSRQEDRREKTKLP
jgi:hypothetical protein